MRRARAEATASAGEGVMARRAPSDRQWPGAQVQAHWRGSGGRWLVWAGRVVVWTVIVLIGYRGVLAIVSGPGSAERTASPRAPSGRTTHYPVAAAEAYALEFGNVYLNFSPAFAAARSKALAAFLPSGADPQLGWNGAGTQRLLDEQVAGIAVNTASVAVVTLLARLDNGGLVELGVPVFASGGAMTVSGAPALLPGPRKAVLSSAKPATADRPTEATLQRQLAAFFTAYAGGDEATLARFLVPGVRIAALRGEVGFGAIDSVHVPVGGSTRVISVTVTWQFPARSAAGSDAGAAAALQMAYQMTVEKRGGSWYVRSIGPSAQEPP